MRRRLWPAKKARAPVGSARGKAGRCVRGDEGEALGARGLEGGAVLPGHRLRGRRLDAEGVDELAVARHAVVEVGAGGEPGHSHRPDPRGLLDALAEPDVDTRSEKHTSELQS